MHFLVGRWRKKGITCVTMAQLDIYTRGLHPIYSSPNSLSFPFPSLFLLVVISILYFVYIVHFALFGPLI